jgi:hypothetical protein
MDPRPVWLALARLGVVRPAPNIAVGKLPAQNVFDRDREKYDLVVQMLKNQLPVRHISKIAQVSFSTISSIGRHAGLSARDRARSPGRYHPLRGGRRGGESLSRGISSLRQSARDCRRASR